MQSLPPDSSNPFSDATNPYASPSHEASAMAGPIVPFTREEARLRLLGPAIGLGTFSVLWMMYMLFAWYTLIVDASRIPQAQDMAEMVAMVIGMALALALFTLPSLLTLTGSVQMFRVKGYYWCWAMAILGVLPCTFCLPFMIPFGIWGMVVLYDARIKLAFYGGQSPFVVGP